jgi:hypothetical protein
MHDAGYTTIISYFTLKPICKYPSTQLYARAREPRGLTHDFLWYYIELFLKKLSPFFEKQELMLQL